MNEVFEKILERLEELRQNQIKELCEHRDFTSEMQSMRGHNILQDAKKIVQEVAEEYKGGWIPCSERLPEQSLNSVIGWDEYRQRCCFVQYYGGRWILGNDIDSVKIIAWQPLPEPYKERD